jgi:hypothetical protein
MDLGLGLTKEKSENGLSLEIGATVGPGVTSTVIKG